MGVICVLNDWHGLSKSRVGKFVGKRLWTYWSLLVTPVGLVIK